MSLTSPELHAVARIDEALCIGCTLCIDACPVDAIVGAAKRMHIVLSALCTGCALCVPPCPVDCIAMTPTDRPWTRHDERAAQARLDARNRRRAVAIAPARVAGNLTGPDGERTKRQAAVAAALARARARRAAGVGVK